MRSGPSRSYRRSTSATAPYGCPWRRRRRTSRASSRPPGAGRSGPSRSGARPSRTSSSASPGGRSGRRRRAEGKAGPGRSCSTPPRQTGRRRDMMSELEGLYGIWLREFKVFQREKSRVISAVAQPIIWLFLLGGGIGASIDTSRIGDVDYQHFLFPGIVAMSTMFGTVFYGLYIVWDRKIDVLKEVLVAPISRITVFFGKVLGGATDALITVA